MRQWLLIAGTALATASLGSMLPAAAGTGTERLSTAQVQAVSPSGLRAESLTADSKSSQRYLVVLDAPPAASYQGGIAGLAATSPLAIGTERLDVNSPGVQAYAAFLAQQQNDFLAQASSVLRRSVEPQYRFKFAINGLAMELSPAEAARLSSQPGVVKVLEDRADPILTDTGPVFIGADEIWEGTHGASLESRGEGMVVGILDTGINPTHPSFAEVDPNDAYVHVNPLGSGNFLGVCDSDSDQYDATFPCNDKLIGAWSFLESWGEESAWDENGHGTHVAGTAAGNNVTTTFQGVEVDLSGVAPRANIISYRVCGGPDTLCNSFDRAAAIEQSILDGVDVLNHSIGGGNSPYTDATSLAFLGATDAGIFSATAAGNSGPGAATVSHRTPWMITVAATTHSRLFARTLDVTGPGTPPAELQGLAAVAGTGPAPETELTGELVYVGDIAADDLACDSLPANSLDGVVALVRRGACVFIDKADNVADAGAVAMVVVNSVGGPPMLMGGMEAATIPSVMLGKVGGDAVIDWVEASGDPATVAIAGDVHRIIDEEAGDVMASFSSRGPGGGMADIIKPDIAAPGVSILAAYVPNDDSFVAIQGTSMASPHIAGAGTLVKAVQPSWTPMEIQSALMSTAVTSVMDTDGETPADAFDMGAGRVDIPRAVRAALLLDETRANFEAAETGDLTSLNLASFANMDCEDSCSWTRDLRSVLGTTGNWIVTVNSDDGLDLSVVDTTFSLNDGATHTLQLSADVSAADVGEWLFGEVVLTEDADQAPSQRFPVAVRKSVPPEYGHYTMVTSWEDASCAMPFANQGGYLDARAFNINPHPAISGDTVAFTLFTDRTIHAFGREFATGIIIRDDGLAYLGDNGPANPWVNRDLTNEPGVEALLAPFWRDWRIVYEENQRGVSFFSLTSNDVPVASVVDWKGVEDYSDSGIRADFQFVIRNEPSVTDHDIIFAMNNLQVPDTVGTVGISGHEGASWRRHAFNDAAIGELEDGMAICFNWVADISEPAFEPDVTGFTGSDLEVTLRAFPQTASLRYTTDGTDPTPEDGLALTNGDSVIVTDGTELRVIAYEGDHVSDVVTRVYAQVPPLQFLDEEDEPLESITVTSGSELSFSVTGGSGDYSDVSSSANQTSGLSATVIDDGDGNYRFVAPSTGAFAGTYEITVTDANGMTQSFTVEVALDLVVERSELLGGAESALLHVRGAVPGTNLNLELQDAGGTPLPSESVASLEDSMVTAVNDEPAGHPASTTVSALLVSESASFRLQASGSPYSDVVGELIAVDPATWYAGHVLDMAGDAIEAAGVRTKDATNELSEPYRTETGASGAFLLGAPVVGELDPEHVLSISADDFQMQEIDGALCLGDTPVCTVYLEGATGYLTVSVPDLLEGEEVDLFIYFDSVLPDQGEVGPFELTGSGDGADSKVLPLDGALTYQRIVGTGFGYQESEADGGDEGFTPSETASETAQAELLMVPTVPLVEDVDVDSINATSARLFATVDPNQRATSVSFLLDDGNGLETIDGGDLAANDDATEVSVTATGLSCGTGYEFFVFAENDKAPGVDSASVSFETDACDEDDVVTPPGSGGGSSGGLFSCSMSNGKTALDPTLPLLLLFGLLWIASRRRALR